MRQFIPYDQIAGSAPHWRRVQKKVGQIKFWHALLFFVGIMIGFELMAGILYLFIDDSEIVSLLNQLGFLAISFIFVRCMHADFREVFPIKKPKVRAVFGCLVIVLGAYCAVNILSVVTMYLMPEQMIWINQAMETESYSGFAAVLVFLNWTLVPAVCEESVHRGVILTGIRSRFQNKYVIALIAGGIFGLFHLYPVRWAATGFVGVLLAMAVLETDNLVYSCLIHFFYNGLLMLVDALSGPATVDIYTAVYSVDLPTIGVYMMFYGFPIAILLYTGFWMIRLDTAPVKPSFIEKGIEKGFWKKVVAPTVGIMGVGFLFLAFG